MLLSEDRSKQNDDYIIHDNLLPEPFWGDLNSKVYILNGNPGYSPADDYIMKDSTLADPLIEATINTLKQVEPRIYWLEPDRSSRAEEKKEDYHPKGNEERDGYDWWSDVTKPLRDALQGKLPSFCNIEYFPYHSKKIKGIIKNLPSNKYVDWWIGNAIEEGKIIIIVRCASDWLKRIEKIVKEYGLSSKYDKNKIIFGASQNIILSQNNLQHRINIGKDEWENIIKNV